MIIDGLEFPDECPEKCEKINKPIDMSSLCFRCPVFTCKKVDGISMLEPEQVNKQMAKLFYEYLKEFQ